MLSRIITILLVLLLVWPSFGYYISSLAAPSTVQVLAQTNWRMKFVDSEEPPEWSGALAIDGDVNTFWATQWRTSAPPPPHEIQIDLGGVYTITKFHYLPRQDGNMPGTIKQYEFYVSGDGVNWGTAVVTGSFASDTAEKVVTIPATIGKFVRLRALSEINDNPWTSMAELTLEGTSESIFPYSAARFQWTWVMGSPPNDGTPTEFRLKCGMVSGQYTMTAIIPPSLFTISVSDVLTQVGQYYCVVVAADAVQESGPSNELSVHVLPAPGFVK